MSGNRGRSLSVLAFEGYPEKGLHVRHQLRTTAPARIDRTGIA